MDKIRIPSYVADWIVAKVENGDSLVVAIDTGWQIMPSRVREWLGIEFNDEVFARAWLDGYVRVEDVRTHSLKIIPEFFEAVKDGRKKFEILRDHKNYRVGEFLELKEYNPNCRSYTGDSIKVEITYRTTHAQNGNHVVLGIKEVKE